MCKSLFRKGLILTIIILFVEVNTISAIGRITNSVPTKKLRLTVLEKDEDILW